MTTSTLTSKGQVTLPKRFREYLGVGPGSAVCFALNPQGQVTVSAAAESKSGRCAHPFRSLRGSLSTGQSTDELMALLRGTELDADDTGFK